MRYLSDDGKVFNYEDECREHEKSIKEFVRQKELEEQKKKDKEILDKEYDNLVDSMKKWLKNSIEFENKYGDEKDKKKTTKDIDNWFADFLLDYFS